MPWLEKKENWLTPGKSKMTPKKLFNEKVYSVTEVAASLAVTRQTIYKWLSIDEPEYAIIPPNAWFKLPNGHIRIREWIVLKIKKGEI